MAIEALMRTDLVSPDHIAVTCCQPLHSIYLTDSNDNGVRQKARKVEVS